MHLQRFIAVLLLISTLLCCAGCSRKPQSAGSEDLSSLPSQTVKQEISLFYCANDSISPYLATTDTNRQLACLLYDPLVKLGTDYAPVYVLAESVVITGAHCVVNLKQASFSDGTLLSAEDVVYSLQLAKKSATRYAGQLADVTAATVVNPLCISIILANPNPGFASMLDFPIIKSHSDTLKDQDNAALPPVGTGRYIIDQKALNLTANPSYYGGAVNIQNITLVNAPDNESISHHLEIGSVDFYYSDLSDCQLPRMKGSSVNTPLQNLVYLGINMNNSLLSKPEMRYALSAALNRIQLASEAYYGYATAASGPFPGQWEELLAYQTIEKSQNTALTVANLEKIGYNKKDADGFYYSASNKPLHFTLLCNSDNPWRVLAAEQIRSQLEKAGIKITLQTVTFEQYSKQVAAGNFELYLGEMRLPNDLDLTQMATQGGSAAWGIVDVVASQPAEDTSSTSSTSSAVGTSSGNTTSASEPESSDLNLAQTIAAYKAGQVSLGDVAAAFTSDMPFLPLCFRNGTLVYNSALKTAPTPTVSDPYFGIENATFQ